MQLLDSLIDGALLLPDEGESQALVFAYVSFMRTGEVPTDLTGAAYAMWVSNLPVLENSRKKSLAGRKGKSESKRESNANQIENQTNNQNEIKRGNYQDSSSSSHSSSASHLDDPQVDTGFTPPTLEEVRSYFAANCLMGDPDQFWATYDSQGWVKGNGMPVHSWTSLALNWGMRQRAMDSEKPADQRDVPKWRPAETVPSDDEIESMRAEVERLRGEL